MRCAIWVCLLLAAPLRADLAPGDKVPDCSKVPLVAAGDAYRPDSGRVPSIEDHLRRDGVLIVHFASPRPRGGEFPPLLLEELAALAKARLSVTYPCQVLVVLPHGRKASEDYANLANFEAQQGGRWARAVPVAWEPTWPQPGLYRTFRAEGEVVTPLTCLIGPDRSILALREANQGGGLYDWLTANLPATLPEVVLPPTADIDLPGDDPWLWPAFRRTVRREASAGQVPDRLPYFYLAWRVRVGRTFASPVVADQTAYVAAENGGVSAVELRNGALRGPFEAGGGWWTTPTVAGDLLLAIDRQGTVTALDRITFAPVWERRLESLITSSPTVADGRLFVGLRRGAVVALDAATGELLWSHQTGGEVSSSPALADGLVLIGSGDRRLYALNAADGTVRWSVETGAAVDSSPLVVGRRVLVGSFDGSLYAVELDNGAVAWRCELGGWVHSSPAVRGDTVYVGTVPIRGDEVPRFAWIDLATGALRASFELPDAVYSSPTVWDELVLVGCRDYHVYAFDATMARTQPVWQYRTRSYVHASPVVVGDTLLVASYDGYLYALRQEKPIATWQTDDVAPRWFMAALARELHAGAGRLVAQAAAGGVDAPLTLPRFEALFEQIRAEAGQPGAAARVLPRDVPPEHPGAAFVEYALTAGLLAGYPDGTFEPSTPTTRYQFSSGLGAVLNLTLRPDFTWRALRDAGAGDVAVEVRIEPSRDRPPRQPSDAGAGHWAYGQLLELGAKGLLPLDDEDRFRGERTVTLADAAIQWNLLADAVRVVRVR